MATSTVRLARLVLLALLASAAAQLIAAQQDGVLRIDRQATLRVSSGRSSRHSGPVPLAVGADSVDDDGPAPVDVVPTSELSAAHTPTRYQPATNLLLQASTHACPTRPRTRTLQAPLKAPSRSRTHPRPTQAPSEPARRPPLRPPRTRGAIS